MSNCSFFHLVLFTLVSVIQMLPVAAFHKSAQRLFPGNFISFLLEIVQRCLFLVIKICPCLS